jgi:hypothetical protein
LFFEVGKVDFIRTGIVLEIEYGGGKLSARRELAASPYIKDRHTQQFPGTTNPRTM